jgi:sugar phosphate isomerase/epimerase
MQIAYVQRLAEIAQQLGAGIVRVFTGYATTEEAYQDDWKVCVEAIRECAGRAERYGVCIGVQNHHDTGVSADAFIEFLNDVDHPNCKAMFDPWAPALQGEDLYECARALAPRMVQTTIADYVRMKRWAYMPQLVNYRPMPAMVRAVPVGEGFIDFESFFKGLREGGFEGPVAYEMCSPLRGGGGEDNLDKAAAESLRRIRELIRPEN